MSAAATAPPSPFMAPQHPPIPGEEFEQAELLAIEKEAIGLFISAHPLKEVREALRAAVDAPLATLPDRKDGDWVTAGGIITQAKKIRTKKGDPMMFATLDDLEGSIEVLIFGKALAEYEGALGVDEVVLVRGRVDHGDKGTSLIAQTVDPFRPSVEEVEAAREAAALEPVGPQALTVRVDATTLPGDDHRRAQARLRQPRRRLRGGAGHRDVGRPAHAAPGGGLPRQRDAEPACRAGPDPRPSGGSGGLNGPATGHSDSRSTANRSSRGKGAEDEPFSYADVRFAPHAGALLRYFRACGPSLYRWTGGGGSRWLRARDGAPPPVVHHRATMDRGRRAADSMCTRSVRALTATLALPGRGDDASW